MKRRLYGFYQNGQALLELSLVVSLLGLFLVWALPLLNERLLERAESLEQAQIILHQAAWRDSRDLAPLSFEQLSENYGYEERETPNVSITVSDNYGFTSHIAPLWNSVGGDYGLAMPIRNLYTISLTQPDEEEWFRFVKLTDDWSPRRVEDLERRPRMLTSMAFTEAIDVGYLQNMMAILPFAKELHSNQLKLGHIAVDVVPKQAICDREACND